MIAYICTNGAADVYPDTVDELMDYIRLYDGVHGEQIAIMLMEWARSCEKPISALNSLNGLMDLPWFATSMRFGSKIPRFDFPKFLRDNDVVTIYEAFQDLSPRRETDYFHLHDLFEVWKEADVEDHMYGFNA